MERGENYILQLLMEPKFPKERKWCWRNVECLLQARRLTGCGKHSNFRDEKCMIERMLIERGHVPCFLPKFHPELNLIERVLALQHLGMRLRVLAQLKHYTKAHCNYSLPLFAKTFSLPMTLLLWITFTVTFAKFITTCFATWKDLFQERNLTKHFCSFCDF